MGKKSRMKKLRRERIARGEPVHPEPKKPSWPDDRPIMASDATFSALLDTELPVLVDFWAEWCGPCKALAPVIEALAKQRAGQLRVVKYDTERNKRVAGELNVRSLPTLVLFKGGEVKDVKTGYTEPDALLDWVDRRIGLKKGLMDRMLKR